MIAAFQQALYDLILYPQEAAGLPDGFGGTDPDAVKCVVDVENRPIPTYGGQLHMVPVTSRPVEGSYEIGGGVALQHEFDVLLLVQHGDIAEGIKRRDAIASQIAMRLAANKVELDQVTDPISGQYATKVTWLIDWTPLGTGDTNQVARFVITFETQWDA